MRRDPGVLLEDVERAGTAVVGFIEGMAPAAYMADDYAQSAVERKFQIIGEALNRLARTDPAVARRIPRLRDVVDFRNLLVHGYDSVDPELVWKYARDDLPKLLGTVRELLAELTPNDPEPEPDPYTSRDPEL